jgi:hypothetical protein
VTTIDLTLEREIQADVVEVYDHLGLKVVKFSQYRLGSGTRQTKGIADLKVYCERKGLTWWHEVKTPSGVQSKEQREFELMVRACHEAYVLGGMQAALNHLQLIEILSADGRAILERLHAKNRQKERKVCPNRR